VIMRDLACGPLCPLARFKLPHTPSRSSFRNLGAWVSISATHSTQTCSLLLCSTLRMICAPASSRHTIFISTGPPTIGSGRHLHVRTIIFILVVDVSIVDGALLLFRSFDASIHHRRIDTSRSIIDTSTTAHTTPA